MYCGAPKAGRFRVVNRGMRRLFLLAFALAAALPASGRTLECRYVGGADNLLHLACEDLEAEDDPALADPRRPRWWRIPLWSAAPYRDSDPLRLARAVLCRRGEACDVRMAGFQAPSRALAASRD